MQQDIYKTNISDNPQIIQMKNLKSIPLAVILLLAAFFCQSCSQVTQNNPSVPNADENYKIEIIDSCEYIVRENGMTTFNNYSFSITHKGNCKFCIKRKLQ